MYQKELAKAKTATKVLTYKDRDIKSIVMNTLRTASDLVGSTLGPNGRVVLIERQENLPPYTTKDGITVFNSMSFANSTQQAVLEAARDASAKTNTEAGDGTTTATVLAAALVDGGFRYLDRNPRLSAQRVMRDLENAYSNIIEPFIKNSALRINSDNDKDLLKKVALVATNGDEPMSSAVMEAFELVGHDGQMTINELAGQTGFSVEKIEGLPIPRGFEDSCGRFVEEFINDKANYKTLLTKPNFILYNGKITDIGALIPVLTEVAKQSMNPENPEESASPNVVVMAHNFSDIVLAWFAQNFKNPNSINIIPVKTPMTQQSNSQYHFLCDMQAYTGATLFDPLSRSLESASVADICGTADIEAFEFGRYRSLVVGRPDEFLVISRAEELKTQAANAASILDGELLVERAALLTGGIAKVNVHGSSEAELKEKRHRVEDAIMAIKGALKYGVLPGCSKTLLTIRKSLLASKEVSPAVKEIMGSALLSPITKILSNGGYSVDEIRAITGQTAVPVVSSLWAKIISLLSNKKSSAASRSITDNGFFYTYNAVTGEYGDAIEMGIIDSAAAVLMSIKNSISVAKMLMTLSGIVVFKRDGDLDLSQAKSYYDEQQAMKDAEREAEHEKWNPED